MWPALPPTVNNSSVELRRTELFVRLGELGPEAVSALARGLSDAELGVRRNAALTLAVLGSRWYESGERQSRLDIESALPALTAALRDEDGLVRSRSAQAIGEIGPAAAPAVPALIELLKNKEEGSRIGACIALRGIGPPANAALPVLKRALADPSNDVRRFATNSIAAIEAGSK